MKPEGSGCLPIVKPSVTWSNGPQKTGHALCRDQRAAFSPGFTQVWQLERMKTEVYAHCHFRPALNRALANNYLEKAI